MAVVGDMLDAAYIDELVKKSAEFGNGKIHIIVNNAGFTWDAVIHKVRDFLMLQNLGIFYMIADFDIERMLDHGQTVGDHPCSAQYGTLQACPGSSAVFPCQRRRAQVYHQYQ